MQSELFSFFSVPPAATRHPPRNLAKSPAVAVPLGRFFTSWPERRPIFGQMRVVLRHFQKSVRASLLI